ncbi:MAG: HEPN domain-containing protein [Syntrophorhabdales bacterium]|jgi:HEPN domain-containing protein
MNPLTTEWIQKAEGDFGTASREIRARRVPNYDAVCFHAQQCAEKYLKALLQEAGIQFGKTHNLVILLDLLLPAEPSWEILRHDMQVLNSFAVYVRYPGESADKATARDALALGRTIRSRARAQLGLEP